MPLTRSITVGISFMPPKAIRRVFPPMVSGVTIILIGVALITAGFEVRAGCHARQSHSMAILLRRHMFHCVPESLTRFTRWGGPQDYLDLEVLLLPHVPWCPPPAASTKGTKYAIQCLLEDWHSFTSMLLDMGRLRSQTGSTEGAPLSTKALYLDLTEEVHALQDWGGGVFCAENTKGFPAARLGCASRQRSVCPSANILKAFRVQGWTFEALAASMLLAWVALCTALCLIISRVIGRQVGKPVGK